MNRIIVPAISALFLLSLAQGCSKGPDGGGSQPAPSPSTDAAPATPDTTATLDTTDTPAPPTSAPMSGKVTETMDAAGYTYVQLDAGEGPVWAAAPQFTVAVGDEVVVPAGMPMTNYHSNSLDRDFDVVYFVQGIGVGGEPPANMTAAPGAPAIPGAEGVPGDMPAHPSPTIGIDTSTTDFTGIEKAAEGHTVADIFSKKAELAGTEVIISGKVVKFSSQIMGRNWLHIQDGTSHEGSNDLTVTSTGTAIMGDTVTIKGMLSTDKDFGAGYLYNVIVEDAEITVQ